MLIFIIIYINVINKMEHHEWLGTFTLDEIKEKLSIGGKIWMYYDKDISVCSVFYIPTSNKSLKKHNIEYDESITESLGPIEVLAEISNALNDIQYLDYQTDIKECDLINSNYYSLDNKINIIK